MVLYWIIVFTCCLGVHTFPTTAWKSLSFSLSSEQIETNFLEDDAGYIYAYIPILSTDGLTLKLHRYFLNTSPPSLLAFKTFTFPNSISKPTIVPLNTKVLLSYDAASPSNSFLVQLDKATLSVESNTTTSSR